MAGHRGMFRIFSQATGGNFAVIAAIVAPVLFGVVGLAVDFSIFFSQKTQMQEAADAAALTAVRESALQGWSESTAQAAADAFISTTLASSGISSAVYESEVTVDEKAKRVTVAIRQDGHGYLLLGLYKSNPQISVSATAAMAGSSNLCLIALDPSSSSALRLTGKAQLAASGCGTFVNSVSPTALDVEPGSKVAADLVCTSGGYSGQNADFNPDPTTDCPQTPDPLAGRPQPTVGGCDFYNTKVKLAAVLLPGVYCGGIEISAVGIVTALPGIYVIKDGKFEITSAAKLIGINTGFFLTGKVNKITFSGLSTVALTAPKTGPMAGILFFQDRNSPRGTDFEISSADARTLVGTIYLSRGNLLVRGKSRFAEVSDWTAIIAQNIRFEDGPLVKLHSDYSGSDIPVPGGIAAQSAKVYLTE